MDEANHSTPVDDDNEDFLEAVLQLPVAVLVAFRDGTIGHVNSHFAARTGWSEEDLRGKRIETLVPAWAAKRHDTYVREFFANPRTRSMGGPGSSVSIKCANGAFVPAEVGLAPCPQADCVAAFVAIHKRDRSTFWLFFAALLVVVLGIGMLVCAVRWPAYAAVLHRGESLVGMGLGYMAVLFSRSRKDPNQP